MDSLRNFLHNFSVLFGFFFCLFVCFLLFCFFFAAACLTICTIRLGGNFMLSQKNTFTCATLHSISIPPIASSNCLFCILGQLIAYELMHASDKGCPMELMKIPIPDQDPHYDIQDPFQRFLPFIRSVYNKKSGMSPNHPRRPVICGWDLFFVLPWEYIYMYYTTVCPQGVQETVVHILEIC